MIKTISYKEIFPYVRFSQRIGIRKNCEYINVKAYENRLVYVLSGKGEISIDKAIFSVSSGSVAIWKPGISYSLLNYDDTPLELITVNFDYTFASSEKMQLNPQKKDLFNPEFITELCEFSDSPILNFPIVLNDAFFAEQQFSAICKEFRNKKLFYEKSLCGIMMQLITEISRFANIKSQKATSTIDSILYYIHEYYFENLNNSELGRIFNYHPNHINRLMLQSTGTTLHRYLTGVRIEKAVEMLQSGSFTVAEACAKSGFSDTAHFSKAFKKIVGKSPSEIGKNNII